MPFNFSRWRKCTIQKYKNAEVCFSHGTQFITQKDVFKIWTFNIRSGITFHNPTWNFDNFSPTPSPPPGNQMLLNLLFLKQLVFSCKTCLLFNHIFAHNLKRQVYLICNLSAFSTTGNTNPTYPAPHITVYIHVLFAPLQHITLHLSGLYSICH